VAQMACTVVYSSRRRQIRRRKRYNFGPKKANFGVKDQKILDFIYLDRALLLQILRYSLTKT
jgi:hypothetical protein